MSNRKTNFATAGRFRLFAALRPVTRAGAIRDVLAGVQLAAMNIPQALGYTKIAGMPVVTGLYTLLLPMVAFAAFGSSRYLVVAADSATAAILAGGLSDLAPIASAKYVALAGTVALLTGILLLAARLLKLGFLADFLSQTVLVGFLTGVGFQVGIAVLGGMLRIETHSTRAIDQLIEIIRNRQEIDILTAEISVAALATLLCVRYTTPRIPGALVVVGGAIAASAYWNLAGRGIDIIGPVTGGLPHLALPAIEWRYLLHGLVRLAGACFVMIVAQSAATARFFAARHRETLDEDNDLIGLSVANLAAGLSGTFVVDGSPTQTAMVESSGGRSQLAHVAAASVVAVVLLFVTEPLKFLPRCVLGSIVFAIAIGMVDLRGLYDIQKESPGEFFLALLTASIVVVVGVEQAIVVAMILSLLHVFRHSYRPQTGVLVLDAGDAFVTRPPEPGTVTEPGLVIYRYGASLFYANVDQFMAEAHQMAESGHARWLVIDAEAITNIDYSAARAVRQLYEDLKREGIVLAFARVADSFRSDLIRHRIMEMIGEDRIFRRLHEALSAFRAATKQPHGHSSETR